MKCFTVAGKVPMNDGMLLVAWTRVRPCSSVMMQEKSCDSRTRVENDVRMRAAAASSAAEMSRVQITSRVMGSNDSRLSIMVLGSSPREG